MERKVTRRDVLRTFGVGGAVAVAGCTGGGSTPEGGSTTGGDGTTGGSSGDAGGETGSDADTSRPDAQPGTTDIAAVTDVLVRPPLEIQVVRAARAETVDVMGIELRPQEGMVAYAVTLAFKNTSSTYVSFVTDALAMLAGDQQVAELASFEELTSDSFGGVALAPGEVRRFELAFETPDEAGRYGVAGVFRVRTLPGTSFEAIERIIVDFARDAGTAPLEQSLDVTYRSLGESIEFQGLDVSVREVFFTSEAGGRTAPAESEFGVVDIAGTNGTALPVAFGIGFGGFAFQDGQGTTYTSSGGARDGRVGDREILSLANGLRQGESAAGLGVAVLPAGIEPLYVVYTPPPRLWLSSGTVSEHKFFWQVR